MATAGGDKKLRIWDRDSGAQVAEAAVGTNLQDMQVGITWPSASKVISVALDGRLICWEVGSGLSMESIVDVTHCLASDSMTGNPFHPSAPLMGVLHYAMIAHFNTDFGSSGGECQVPCLLGWRVPLEFGSQDHGCHGKFCLSRFDSAG